VRFEEAAALQVAQVERGGGGGDAVAFGVLLDRQRRAGAGACERLALATLAVERGGVPADFHALRGGEQRRLAQGGCRVACCRFRRRGKRPRARRLKTLAYVSGFDVIPIAEEVAEAWAELRVALRDAGRRLGVNDAWIAATAMALRIPLVSQDRDFEHVPGLSVVLV